MSPQTAFDPSAEAGALADLFSSLSDSLDDFRLATHNPPLTQTELDSLRAGAQGLQETADHFVAAAIGATLQTIQSDLGAIKDVTAEAAVQLGHLDEVSKVIAIASSALELGTAIASGDLAAIKTAALGFVQTVRG